MCTRHTHKKTCFLNRGQDCEFRGSDFLTLGQGNEQDWEGLDVDWQLLS